MPRQRKRLSTAHEHEVRSSKKMKSTSPPIESNTEVLDDDDLCSICNLLLLNPVTTTCRHTFCESCFSHWADISLNTQRIELGLDIDEEVVLPPREIEAKCPMCRTVSAAPLNQARNDDLLRNYPMTYAARSQEHLRELEDEDGNLVEPITIYIGNEHNLTRRESDGSGNIHSWRLFIRLSRNDIVEEVHVFLHPTFRQNHIILTRPPFDLRRLGWGTFLINCAVLLRAGWSWVSSDAEDTPDGAPKGKLSLQWMLDFNGRGSQARCVLKVKRQKEDQMYEDERQSEVTRRLWNRQRETDPDYIPPPDT